MFIARAPETLVWQRTYVKMRRFYLAERGAAEFSHSKILSMRGKHGSRTDDGERLLRHSCRLKRMTVGNVEIARRVLVDGISQVDAATESGLSKQRVGAVIKAVQAAGREIPPDWEHVDVWLPPELAAKVRRMAEEERGRIS
ncbi:TrfB-related DNA-binding protein [Caballeronia insecticola]|uniref:TrfB-related DNA-binding protein n=1 Tax=Caballeronia insecticola TaxID=758793 RepID=UPI001E3E9055|nr:TrfB-related DNA-binding protein [Caballeronia insecticola]